MAQNNQAQDRYNAPRNIDSDFETFNFEDLPVGELFWLTTEADGDTNTVHRKVSETEGTQLRNQVTSTFDNRLKVYQRT